MGCPMLSPRRRMAMVSVMVRAGASMAWAAAFPRSEATLASCSVRGGRHGRAWCRGCVRDEVRDRKSVV